MIKIVLKNFRKFEKNEFCFNEHLNLISGKSGKGKTTIFMAIIFALTGDGKKIITYGKTSCTVKLEIDVSTTTQDDKDSKKNIKKLSIMRSKRPNRVTVDILHTNTSKSYEDKEAQAIIDDFFPQYHLGYMSQRVDNKSFILMSPMDKMRFIQKVAFGDENVDALNKSCRELIKERKDDMMLTVRQRETTEKMLGDLDIKKIDVVKGDIDEIDEESQKFKLNHLENDIQQKKRLLDKTISLTKIKNDLKKQLDDIPIVTENINEIEDKIKNIHVQTQLWENYQREKKKLDRLEKPSDLKKDEIKVMISDMKQMIELQKQVKGVTDLNKKLTVVNQQIKDVSIPLICPECDNKLELWCDNNGVAILKKDRKTGQKPITYENAKKIEEQKYKIQSQLHELEQKQVELSTLQEDYPDLGDPKAQLDVLYKIWRDDEEYEKQEAICKSFKLKSPSSNVGDSNLLLMDLKQKQKYKYSRSEKESSYKAIKLDYDVATLQEEIDALSCEMESAQSKQTRMQSLKYWDKVGKLLQHETVLNKSYPRAVKLQSIIKSAEKLAIEETIEQINLHAQLYLDYFLENVSVCLIFDKDGTKLNVNVIQDGFESDLNNLSGGELARVILAFTIALAEMNNVKLLLLDECVSSLDQDTTTNVIQTVRDNFNGTIICIAHQTTTGIFDHVLEL